MVVESTHIQTTGQGETTSGTGKNAIANNPEGTTLCFGWKVN